VPAQTAQPHKPRTLVVSESPISLATGFGVTLKTFFANWQRENLIVFYTMADVSPADDLPMKQILLNIPGHQSRRAAIAFSLGMTACWRDRYSASWLKRTLKDWRPQIVYTLFFSYETLRYAAWVAAQTGSRLIVHMADGSLPPAWHGQYKDEERKLFEQADARIVISEEMKSAYESYYQLDFQILHNGAPLDLLSKPAAPSKKNDRLIVRYLGSLVPRHHFNSVEDIAAAAARATESGQPVRFELYGGEWTSRYALSLVDEKTTFYGGAISREEGYELLRSADLLVLPVNFDQAVFDDICLSFPTKLPEYLGSGSPTLVYGPAGTAPVEFCRRNGLANLQCNRSVKELVDFFKAIAREPEKYRTRAQMDLAFAKQSLSAENIRGEFERILIGRDE
jgi:glycosyltransferase involved in cell wall biosynthesis